MEKLAYTWSGQDSMEEIIYLRKWESELYEQARRELVDKIADVTKLNRSIPSHIKESTKRAMAKAIGATNEQIDLAEKAGWTLWKSFKILKGQVVAEKDGVIYGPITNVNELLVTERMGGIDQMKNDVEATEEEQRDNPF